MAILVAAFAFGVASPVALADEAADLILSKTFWQKIDWSKAESSALWQLPSWAPYDKPQDGKNTFVKEGTVTLFGEAFSAGFARVNNRSVNQHYVTLFAKVTKERCDSAVKELTALFRAPVTNDGSTVIPIAADVSMKLVNYDYEWNIGSTRLFAGCLGSANQSKEPPPFDPDSYHWSMKFSHRSISPRLTPKFALTCTRVLTNSINGATTNAEDLVAWFDLFWERVLRPDLVKVSDKDSFHATDDTIQFSMTNDAGTSEYTINRITGSLSAVIKSDGKTLGRITGKCEKTAAPVRKF
ncbi:MAG: hypothetical protein KBA31_13900 [Alphaproteobacteria bacterium]|nr:hypothetical protein [Alphaproteobacteria bacterium]